MSHKPTELTASSLAPHESRVGPTAFDHVQEALRGLQYGQVTVIVQDGIVVQVERTERKRLDGAGRKR